MMAAGDITSVHEELLKKSAVDAVKRAADNEKYARQIRDLMHVVADDLRRTVAQADAAKLMDDEQAARVHALYFKSCIANLIQKCNTSGKSDPMVAVREQLLREVAQKEATMAAEDEQVRRTIENIKHNISDDIRRKVARKSADGATELEQAQRVTIDNLHEISDELRRNVAAREANNAMEAEKVQRIQANHFKNMVMGHIATNQEMKKNSNMTAVQAELLKEIVPVQ